VRRAQVRQLPHDLVMVGIEWFERTRNVSTRYPKANGVDEVDDPRAYMQVAQALREQIEDGRLKPGGCMASIDQICRESGRSRQTVGKALRVLEREGVIVRVVGHPYYVNDVPGVTGRQDRSFD
jgi:hypothetical protein